MASTGIRGQYEAHGVQRYYEEQGAGYANPHFPTLQEVVPKMLDKLLTPLLPLQGDGLLDLCCGAGELTIIVSAWQKRRGHSEGAAIRITGADPYTREGFKRATGREAEGWSFEDVCAGVLEEEPARKYDVVAISYAVHLLEKSRYYAFFQALARCCRHLLIISPTKNKGLVEAMHGWEEAEYLTEQKVHARFYRSLFAD